MLGRKLVTRLGKAVAAAALLSGAVLAFSGGANAITPPEGPGPWYVNPVTGNDANSCLSPSQACKTIAKALIDEGTGNPGTPLQDTIFVSAGVDPEPGPISVAADNDGVSIVGVGQSIKKKKQSTIVDPSGNCTGTADTGGLLNLDAVTPNGTTTVSNLVLSGGNCTGQTAGIVAGGNTNVTKVTILAAAPYGIEASSAVAEGPVTLNASSDTIGSATSCSTTATETSSGNIITVAKVPKCAKGFTAVTVGSGNTPDESAAFKLTKTEIQTTTALSVDNGDTVFFNTTPFGYSQAGVDCVQSGSGNVQCNVSNSAIIGGGTFLSGADGIAISGGAGANVFGNTITGNADSAAPSGSNFGEGVGVLVEPGTGSNKVIIGAPGKDGNKFSGNDNGVGAFGTASVSAQPVTVNSNTVSSGSANKGIGVAAFGLIHGFNYGSLDILNNTVSQGIENTGGGIGLIGSSGVTVGGLDNSGSRAGNDVTGNGLGIYITSVPAVNITILGSPVVFPACALGSTGNTVTNNTVTNNTLFGIDVDGVASLPELVSENVCGSDLNGNNTIESNVVTNNGTFANAEGVNGADMIDFGNYTPTAFPSAGTYPPYKFTLAAGDQITGCTGETPCTFSAQVYDTGALSPGEKIPEGTKFVLGNCVSGVSGSCMTAFTAATGSGFQTISNNPLAPSTLNFTSEAGALSSLTTPITAPSGGQQFTSAPAGNVTQTYASDGGTPNIYGAGATANVCTNGDGGPGMQTNTLTSNQESDSAVFNAVTSTAGYDAC